MSVTNFSKQFPTHFELEDVTGAWTKFLSALETELDLVLASVDAFSNLWDILATDPKYLPYLSQQKGWTLDATSPVSLQRKLVRLILPIYQKKGTAQGIVDIVNTMLGIVITVVQPWADAWRLGADALGTTAELGPSVNARPYTNPEPYTFYVVTPRALTTPELAAMTALVSFMRRADTHFRIVQPSVRAKPFLLRCSRLRAGDGLYRGHPSVAHGTGDWLGDTYCNYLGQPASLAVTSGAAARYGALAQGGRYVLRASVACYIRQGNSTVAATSSDFILAAATDYPLTPGDATGLYVSALAVDVGSGAVRITRTDTDRAC